MLRAYRQAPLALLCKAPALFLQDRQEVVGVLGEVGLLVTTACDAAADGDGPSSKFSVHMAGSQKPGR
jgi:hypothetical protein